MKKSKRDIILTYDAIAENFDATRFHPWPDIKKFSETLSPGQLVLDLGCGNGRDLRFLEERGLKVIGLDFSSGQLLSVIGKGCDADVIQGDVVSLPFRDGTGDAALLSAVLHHIPDAGERSLALREAHRCLKPGGLCLVGVWSAEQRKVRENIARAKEEFQDGWEPGDALVDWKMPDGRIFQRYYHLFTEKEFERLLASTEFGIQERWFSTDNHYAILCKE
jgi:SAM-dependent methyltransferase